MKSQAREEKARKQVRSHGLSGFQFNEIFQLVICVFLSVK